MEINIKIGEEDTRLVESCLQGDELAFSQLLNRYLKPIYGFLYNLVKDSAQVEDLTQETFIKAWKNLDKFDTTKNFKAWLFTIAKNNAFDWLKKKKSTPFSFFEDEEGNNKLESVAEDAILPDEILERKEIVSEMAAKLALIPEKYSTILIMRYKEDFTLREIAQILDSPYNTIKAYHRKALIRLKEVFLEK